MPELPEVEIVKQSLSKKITFKKIQKIIIKNGNLRFKIAENFVSILKNSRIKKISRFSKYLIIFLDLFKSSILYSGITNFALAKRLILKEYFFPLLSHGPRP